MIKEVTASVITLVALGIGANAVYQGVNPNNLLQTSKVSYEKNSHLNNHYKEETKQLSKAKVANAMVKGQVNLDSAKKDATDRVNGAFNEAYGNVDKNNYKHVASDLRKTLGKDFGTQLGHLINPGDSIPYSNSIVGSHIAFGKYDTETHQLPMVVTVEYKATDSSKNNSNDYWTVEYNAKSKTFNNAKHEAILPPQNN